MATASSSKTAVDETSQEDHIWMELRLLQSIVIQSRLGQTMLKLMDHLLWIIEKSIEWSLPRKEMIGDTENRKGSGKPELVRPLPWFLFLPTLVLLRAIRVIANIGAPVFNYPKITPSGMVKSVQICRRYLKASMSKGKEKESKDKRLSINEAKKALIKSIRLTLSSLSCLDASKPSPSPPPTKIHVSSVLDPDPVTTTPGEKSAAKSTNSTENSANESNEEESKESVIEKIARLASESSEDDDDFDPAKCDPSTDSSSDEDKNSDGDVSPSEIRDVIEDAMTFNRNLRNKQFLNSERTSASAPRESVYGKRSSAEESRDKVDERRAYHAFDRSNQEGDPTFYSPISSDSDTPKEFSAPIAEQSKSSGEANNGAVTQRRGANASKHHKGKRTGHGNRKKK